jgi:hypothetical protein
MPLRQDKKRDLKKGSTRSRTGVMQVDISA